MRMNRSMPTATVIPVIEYSNVVAAGKWLEEAFGFEARLRIGDHRVQLQSGCGAIVIRNAGAGDIAPLGGASVMVRVEEVDAHFERARIHGARIVSELANFPYGERQYSCLDLAGHHWTFSQTIADTDPATWGGEQLSNGICQTADHVPK